MTSTKPEKSVVVVQLSGGNDALNTVIPYNEERYYDYRPYVHIAQEDVLKINDELGLNPALKPIKRLWDSAQPVYFSSTVTASIMPVNALSPSA